MSLKELEKIIADTEKELGKELSDRFTKAVQARDVQAKADKETNSSDKKCPREVQAVFDAALSAEMTKVQRDYKDVQYSPDMTTKMKGKQWIASVKTDASLAREKRGGASHVVKEGETVFGIAEKHYGSGAYWPAIEDENPFIVSKGDFIVCSMGLKIPSVDVVKNTELVAEIAKPKASKDSDKPAMVVWEPDWELEIGGKPTTVTHKLPGLTVVLTAQFKGKGTVKGMGPIPAGFNVRSHESEIKAAWKDMEGSVKFDINGGLTEVGASSALFNGKAGIKVTNDGSFGASIECPPKKFSLGGRDCEVTLSIEISAKLIPDPPPRTAPVTEPVGERVRQWAQENRTAILVVVGVSALIVGIALAAPSGGGSMAGAVAFVRAASLAAPGIAAMAK
jgi:hypothetical protein